MRIFSNNRPKTPSQRHVIKISKKKLIKKPFLKCKLIKIQKKVGKSNSGRITVRHKGGGHKKRFRQISFNIFKNKNFEGLICSLEYDPNRGAYIMSVYDVKTKQFKYMLAPTGVKPGDVIKSGKKIFEPKIGYSMPLTRLPIGSLIHNITLKKHGIAKLTRAAGCYSIITEKADNTITLKLSSGKNKKVSSNCYATLGVLSNEALFLVQKGKAGCSRWLGIRPSVRGVAMNPVDHPNGGGEGKKSGMGKTPWGKSSKK